MAPVLSDLTRRHLDVIFADADRAEAARLLVERCGHNLPFCDNLDATALERIRFAALKLGHGDLAEARRYAATLGDWIRND